MDKILITFLIIGTTIIELFALFYGHTLSNELIKLFLALIIIIDILALIGLVLELT